MMLDIKRFIFAATLSLSLPVSAEGYFGASGTYALGDISGVSVDFGAGTFRLGAVASKYFAVEINTSLGFIDYDYGPETVSLDSVISGVVKIGPTKGSLQPYISLGGSRSSITISGPYGSVSNNDTDLAYGFGATYFGERSDGVGLNIEYMRHYDKNNLSLTGLSLGFVKQF